MARRSKRLFPVHPRRSLWGRRRHRLHRPNDWHLPLSSLSFPLTLHLRSDSWKRQHRQRDVLFNGTGRRGNCQNSSKRPTNDAARHDHLERKQIIKSPFHLVPSCLQRHVSCRNKESVDTIHATELRRPVIKCHHRNWPWRFGVKGVCQVPQFGQQRHLVRRSRFSAE